MRHRKGNEKLGLPTDQRMALIKNGAKALLLHKQIKTTDKRASQISRYVEKMITKAKTNDVTARRSVMKMINDAAIVDIVFSKDMLDKYKDVKGGYTRTVKFGIRRGDASSVSVLELI